MVGQFIGMIWTWRNSHRRCSIEKSALKNFIKFTRKHLCQSFLFNKVAGLRSYTFLTEHLRATTFKFGINSSKYSIQYTRRSVDGLGGRGWRMIVWSITCIYQTFPESIFWKVPSPEIFFAELGLVSTQKITFIGF